MTTPCPTCRTIHCASDVVAVNRFDVHTPTRYMPAGGGVTRSTRAEAMADVCASRTGGALMPESFTPGDRVYVTDPALAEMRAIMSRFGHESAPNHHGTVDAIWDGDMVLVNFDDGVGAPYPLDMVRHLPNGDTA